MRFVDICQDKYKCERAFVIFINLFEHFSTYGDWCNKYNQYSVRILATDRHSDPIKLIIQTSEYSKICHLWGLVKSGACGQVELVDRWSLWTGGACGQVELPDRWKPSQLIKGEASNVGSRLSYIIFGLYSYTHTYMHACIYGNIIHYTFPTEFNCIKSLLSTFTETSFIHCFSCWHKSRCFIHASRYTWKSILAIPVCHVTSKQTERGVRWTWNRNTLILFPKEMPSMGPYKPKNLRENNIANF